MQLINFRNLKIMIITLSPERMLPSKHAGAPGLGELCRKGDGKSRRQEKKITEVSRFSRHDKAGAHMNSQRVMQHAQCLHRSTLHEVLELKEVNTHTHP